MTLTELLPSLKELGHDEKLAAFEFLKKELERETLASIFTEREYHIYTPFGGEEAAAKLMEMLGQKDG